MKKILFLCIFLLAGWTAFAQSPLDGTWLWTQTESDKTDENSRTDDMVVTAIIAYTFVEDTFLMNMAFIADIDVSSPNDKDPSAATFNIEVEGSNTGKFKLNDNTLTLKPDKGKPQVEVKSNIQGVPGGGILKNLLISPLKKELTSALKEPASYTVVSVSDTELVLQEILSAEDKKKGIEAGVITLIKGE